MILVFTGIVVFDGCLDGSATNTKTDDQAVQGTLFAVLIALLIILSQLEFAKLAAARDLKAFTPVTTIISILLAGTWYVPQFMEIPGALYVSFALAVAFVAFVLYQYLGYGTAGVLANCGLNCLSVIYLGALSGFALAIRINFGLWPLLMYIFVVKSSDIGAYASGTLWGKHKFSPQVSPSKTWEGMAGAVMAAVIVALAFALVFGIMTRWLAVVFGLCFAFVGQLGDLAESMMKRDAELKDSANKLPGFGGILDVIDSPLAAAPFAYLFFALAC
jgi:phosphatidate cytidylyltransferase